MKSSKSMQSLPVYKSNRDEAVDFRQPRDLLVDTTNRSTYRYINNIDMFLKTVANSLSESHQKFECLVSICIT